MRTHQNSLPTLPVPGPSRLPGKPKGAPRGEAQGPRRAPACGKARELDRLLWLDLLVIGVLVLLLALAKASL